MVAALLALVLTQDASEPEQHKVWVLPHPVIAEIGEHAKSLPIDAPFLRYIVFPYADAALYDWHVWTVNMIASDLRNTEIVFPVAADPEGLWVAWDLRQLAPRVIKDGELIKFDVLRLMGAFEGVDDLSLYRQLDEPIEVNVATIDPKTGLVVTAPAKRRRLIDSQFPAQDLLEATQATTPVVTLFEFQRQILSEDYYRFLGTAVGANLNVLLKALGWDIDESRSLLAIMRALIAYSGITRGPRAVEFIPGRGNRLDRSDAMYMRSIDFDREEVSFFEAENDLFQNLFNDANSQFGEHIFQRANGGLGFGLTVGADLIQKVQQDFVDSVTKHGLLEVGISCIGCHLQGELRGVQPIQKDFARLMKNNLQVLVQLVSERESISPFEVQQQLLSLYQWQNELPNGKPPRFIADARDQFSDFCVACCEDTGVRPEIYEPAMRQPEEFGQMTRDFWKSYVVDPIGADGASLELGIDPTSDASATLRGRISAAGLANAFEVIPAFGGQVGREQWTEAKLGLYEKLLKPQDEKLAGKEDSNE